MKFNYAKNTSNWQKWFFEYQYGAFYIFPPDGMIEPIDRLRETYDPKSATICQAHISLSEPLTEPLTQTQIEELQKKLSTIKPFKMKYGPLKTYPPYPGVAFDINPKGNFSELRSAIHSTSLFAHSELKRKDIDPHVTIAEFISMERSEELKKELQGNVEEGSFMCDSIEYAVPNDDFYFERVFEIQLGK